MSRERTYYNGYEYRLVSTKGEYAGPCPFTGRGDDRFHIFSNNNNWYCRNQGRPPCPGCPGKPCSSGGAKGWFDDDDEKPDVKAPKSKPPDITYDRVMEFHKELDDRTLDYLDWRGINETIARRFKVGTNCRRLTIPCLVKDTLVYGIKKRWIGTPPEDYIDKYTMEPGSRGKSIFNYDRLVQRKRWHYFVIVEGVIDVMLLEQVGVPAIAPFGGGGVWDDKWNRSFDHVDHLMVIADNDDAGIEYARKKVEMIGHGTIHHPPEGEDIGEAHQEGIDVQRWLVYERSKLE